MTHAESKWYHEDIKPQELASLVAATKRSKSSEESDDEAEETDDGASGSKKSKAAKKKLSTTPKTLGAGAGTGAAVTKIGTPSKKLLCMAELAAQLDVLDNGQTSVCKSKASGCYFEHVLKGQPKQWVVDQVSKCKSASMSSGGTPTAFGAALAAAVAADAKKLFK